MSKDAIPRLGGWVIQPIGPNPNGGGDTHDTFKVDPNGNVSGGHTTIRTPGGSTTHMPWTQK